MSEHTVDGLISLIRNLSVYRSDKTVAQQKEEACTYAAALAGERKLSNETLKELREKWPGGLDEIDASITSWRERAMESGWKHMAADYLMGLHQQQEDRVSAHNYFACAARNLLESIKPAPEGKQP
jgi:hypothetical protein